MADKCLNKITIEGSSNNLATLNKKIQGFLNDSETDHLLGFMHYMIGISESDNDEDEFEYNLKRFGTSSDIERMQLILTQETDHIQIEFETDLTPALQFISNICKKFEVKATTIFSELENDFGGRATFDSKGNINLQEYSAQETLFRYDYARFISDTLGYLEFNEEEKYKDYIDSFPFLDNFQRSKVFHDIGVQVYYENIKKENHSIRKLEI